MLNIRSLLSVILTIVFLSSIQSFADTFVVTNLNDPGAGSLRQAIANSNGVPGPDEIVFEEGLEGTIVLNLGQFDISDDLNINGPGADNITIDADNKSRVFLVHGSGEERNIVVTISGLRLINGNDEIGGLIVNREILTVESTEFINGNASVGGGGAIETRTILTVDRCLFENKCTRHWGGVLLITPAQ
jgi:hypothetical protein